MRCSVEVCRRSTLAWGLAAAFPLAFGVGLGLGVFSICTTLAQYQGPR